MGQDNAGSSVLRVYGGRLAKISRMLPISWDLGRYTRFKSRIPAIGKTPAELGCSGKRRAGL